MMIEADIRDDDTRDQPRIPLTSPNHFSMKSQFVDFDRFLSEYWPHFSSSLTGGYGWLTSLPARSLIDQTSDALPVWNEIMGLNIPNII